VQHEIKQRNADGQALVRRPAAPTLFEAGQQKSRVARFLKARLVRPRPSFGTTLFVHSHIGRSKPLQRPILITAFE
jgi:hypothetical protein